MLLMVIKSKENLKYCILFFCNFVPKNTILKDEKVSCVNRSRH